MPDEKYVPLDVFVKTTKTLLMQIYEVGIAMQVLRSALMNIEATDLPVREEYLRTVDRNIRQDSRYRAALANIEKLGTSEDIESFLKSFEGPIQ